MKKIIKQLLVVTFLFLVSCSTIQQIQNMIVSTNSYFRVENFPSQREATLIGTFSDSQVEFIFEYSIQDVWKSTIRTAKKIEGLTQSKAIGLTLPSLRPIVLIDEEKFIIQNGKVEDAGDIGRINYVGYGSDGKGWADEIIIQLFPLSNKQTKILVKRNLYEGEPVVIDKFGTSFKDKLVKRTSNGNYERWVITQIDDDLQGKLKRGTIAVKQLKKINNPIVNFSFTISPKPITKKFNFSKIITSLNIAGYRYQNKILLQQIFKNLGTEATNNIDFVFHELTGSLDKNIDDVFKSNGFEVIKIFEDFEKLNYPDREAVYLVLDEKINLNIIESYNPNQKTKVEIKSSAKQDTLMPTILYGKIKLSGNAELVLYEPFSREKMWSKTINLETHEKDFSLSFTFNQEEYYGGEINKENYIFGEDYRAEAISQILSIEYPKVMNSINDSINSEEIVKCIDAAKKLREKRKY
ncbi:hypothetical protein C0389_08160 [bacterium]|nr:hypothetical protein [bacterium]